VQGKVTRETVELYYIIILNFKTMDRETLIKDLLKLADESDYETAQYEAVDLLLKYIDDEEIEEAFRNLGRYYA